MNTINSLTARFGFGFRRSGPRRRFSLRRRHRLLSASLVLCMVPLTATAEVFVEQVDVDAFVFAEDTILWSSDCGRGEASGQVQRKPASGGPTYTVYRPSGCTDEARVWSETVAADSGAVYWIDARGRVLKRRWNGTGVEELATMERLRLASLARPMIVAGETRIYWVEHTLDSNGESISKSVVYWAGKDGSTGRQLLFDLAPYYVKQIAAIGDYLYFLTSDRTLRRGSTPFDLEILSRGAVQGFAVSANATSGTGPGWICWASVNFAAPLTEIWSAALSNPRRTVRHYSVRQGWAVNALAMDGAGNVYWHEPRGEGGGPIRRSTLLGNVSVFVVNAPLQQNLVSNAKHLFWKASDRRIDRSATATEAVALDFEALSLEAIQAVQNPTNDVPLVARKATYVRLFSRLLPASGGPTSLPLAEPWAILRAYRVENGVRGAELLDFGSSGVRPLRPETGTPEVKRADPDRGDEEDSLWFLMPDAWTEHGTIDLVAVLNPARTLPETDYANNTVEVRLSFEAKEVLALYLHRGYYRMPDGSTQRYGELGRYSSTFERALSVLPTRGFSIFWSIVELGKDDDFDMKNDGDRSRLLCQLNAQRSEYLCKYPDASPSIRFCAIAPNLGGIPGGEANDEACWWKDDSTTSRPAHNQPWSGMTMAHEMGHVFDQKHVNCGGPDGPHEDYLYANECWLAGAIKTKHGGGSRAGIGWDPISGTVIRHTEAADFMTYMSPQWTSDERWRRIFNHFRPGFKARRSLRPSARELAPEDTLLAFRGRVAEGEEGSDFLISYPVNSLLAEQLRIELDGPGDRTSWELRAYDESGKLLSVVNPLVQEIHESEPKRWLFLGLMDPDPAMRRVDLVLSGDPERILASRVGGGSPPRIELLRPLGGESVEQHLVIRWEGQDPDGDSLEYVLRYSRDDGETWDILETGFRATELELETSFLPGGTDCRIQVEASDGILSSVAISEPFDVQDRAPRPLISVAGVAFVRCPDDPPNTFRVGDPVVLTGSAVDPEAGPLSGEQLKWSVTGPAERQGNGDRLELADLAPGEYAVSLEAVDPEGSSGFAEATFVVAPLTLPLSSSTPTVDGFVADGAYRGQGRALRLRYETGEIATVVLSWNGDALFVGWSGLPVGAGEPRDWVAVCLDPDHGGDEFAQPDDYRFVLYADGEVRIDRGTGSGWAPLASSEGLTGRVSQSDGRWNAELRIDSSWLAGREGERIGLRAGQYHRRFSGDDTNWPRISGWRSPRSWGAVVLGGESDCDPANRE